MTAATAGTEPQAGAEAKTEPTGPNSQRRDRRLSVQAVKIEDVPRPKAPLIGRGVELATLQRTLDAAALSDARAVVLSGDAGVGKTRILAELARRADAGGMITLIGHCVDFGDAGLPYVPFSEALGRLAAERPELAEPLLAEFPAYRPADADPAHDGAPTAAPDERSDRSDLFEAVLGALTALSERAPVVLIVEDVHWADQVDPRPARLPVHPPARSSA